MILFKIIISYLKQKFVNLYIIIERSCLQYKECKMKLKNAYLRLAFILISTTVAFGQSMDKIDPNYNNSELKKLKELRTKALDGVSPEKQKGWKYIARYEYFWAQRLFPDMRMSNAYQAYNQLNSNTNLKKDESLQSVTWSLMGPSAAPTEFNGSRAQGLGRVNIIRFHPQNKDEFWIGSATGGVWKTTNKGKNWTNFPFTQFMSLGVSDIAFSNSNPNTVYVATGDVDATVGSSDGFYSIGIIKTIDGGANWTITNFAYELSESVSISRILVQPSNPNIVIAATNRGIYKSTDGGQNWNNVISGNFRDMEAKPDDFNILYSATYSYGGDNKIYKSTDAGENWHVVYNLSGVSRTALSVTKANVDYLYVLCGSSSTNGYHSFLVSVDLGESFEAVSDVNNSDNILGWYDGTDNDYKGQAIYDMCMAVSPTEESKIFAGGINVWKSSGYGYSWNRNTNWYNNGVHPFIHADQHDLQYNPLTNDLFVTNDGGVYYSSDDGNTWNDISEGLSIMQFYKISQSTSDPDMVIAGAQDNGTNMYTKSGWKKLYSGDGMDCAVDPFNNNVIYLSVNNGAFLRSENGGQYFDFFIGEDITGEEGEWVTPFATDPNTAGTVYAGYSELWKNSNYGDSFAWTKVTNFNSSNKIDYIAIAPSNSKYIYLAIDGIIKFTKDGGANWNQLYVASKFITGITVDPNDPTKIWISLSGYSANEKVYHYNGKKWINLTGNIPNVPVNVICYQKNSPNRVYIGTDAGIYYSDNLSNIWENYSGDQLPNMIIMDMEIYNTSTPAKLRVGTYGRGLWEAPVITSTSEPIALYRDGKAITAFDTFNICYGDFVEITAQDGLSNYVWSNGETGKSIKFTQSGIYSLKAKYNDIEIKSPCIEVSVEYSNPISITNKTGNTFCVGDTVELTASLGFTQYQWSNGESTRKININTPGKYYVIGTKDLPCPSYSDTIDVVFGPYPSKPVINKDQLELSTQEYFKYQWFLNGSSLKNDTNRTLTIRDTGKYVVEVKNEYLCSMISDTFLITGEMSVIDNNIKIFPNPSNGQYNISIEGYVCQTIEYTISNSIGMDLIHYSGDITQENYKQLINLEAYPAGVYFLKLKLGNEMRILKLIKQ